MNERKHIKVSPSLMCANFLKLEDDLKVFEDMGIDYLHIDIMDGHYVPNFTLGPGFCKMLSEHSPIPLDIHLMIEHVDSYIPLFACFKNAVVCFHPEVSYHPIRSLQLIKSYGARAGIAMDPAMPLEAVKHMLPDTDMICIMTVNPGYAGGKLVPQAIDKIRELDAYIKEKGYSIEIEVDGNVSWENIPRMIAAGAHTLVTGSSSMFEKGGNLRDTTARLFSLIGRD